MTNTHARAAHAVIRALRPHAAIPWIGLLLALTALAGLLVALPL